MHRLLTPSQSIALFCGVFSLFSASSASALPVTPQQQAAQQAEGAANSALYNSGYGMSPGEENRAISGSNRDPNGNLLIVNGSMSRSSSFYRQNGFSRSGAGMPESPNTTVIGDTLNLEVTGEGNTGQRNSSDQTAGAPLNGKLKF